MPCHLSDLYSIRCVSYNLKAFETDNAHAKKYGLYNYEKKFLSFPIC